MIWWVDIFSIKIPASRCRNVILISNCNFGDGWPTSSLTCQYKVLFFAVCFLNVTSKCLPEGMHYYTGYLFCFSPLCFQPFGIAILAWPRADWPTSLNPANISSKSSPGGPAFIWPIQNCNPPWLASGPEIGIENIVFDTKMKIKLSELWTYPISQDDIVCWAGKSNLLNGNELIECLTHVHRLIFKPENSVVFWTYKFYAEFKGKVQWKKRREKTYKY